jgi:taurine transport system substrate-binding protein
VSAAAVAVTTALLAAGCGGSSSSTSQSPANADTAVVPEGAPTEIRIGYQGVPNGDLVVKNQGWLEEAFPGTTITWTKFESGGDVNTAIIGGSLDIGLAGSSPVTAGLSEPLNIPYQVPWIFDVIGEAESLVVKNDSGVTDIAGLEGKKVGTPFASTSHYSLLAALQEAGVNPESVKLVDLQPPDILAAWQRGDIDAAYVWSPTLDELKQDGTVLATSAELAKKGYPTYDLAVVTKDFLSQYPEAVTTWLEQQNRAVELIQRDPAEAAVAIAAELGITPEEAQAQIKGLVFLTAEEQMSEKYLGTPAEPGAFADGLLKAAEFLESQQKIEAVPSLETLQAGIDTESLNDAVSGS